ncbi:MAG: hypothetical protein GY834_11795, partial [Bacteroidetes bacterium]|nr:hypothetical protein [Bacteroidota bacterium]
MLFIFKESIEFGFKNYLQLGPTYQYDVLNDSEIKSIRGDYIIQFMQSEERGRFYRNISEYRVYKTNTIEEFENDKRYKILNLYQICQLLKIEGVFTN